MVADTEVNYERKNRLALNKNTEAHLTETQHKYFDTATLYTARYSTYVYMCQVSSAKTHFVRLQKQITKEKIGQP